MSERPILFSAFSLVSTQVFPDSADSCVGSLQDFVPSVLVAAAGGLVSGYLAVFPPFRGSPGHDSPTLKRCPVSCVRARLRLRGEREEEGSGHLRSSAFSLVSTQVFPDSADSCVGSFEDFCIYNTAAAAAARTARRRYDGRIFSKVII
jgi:hypothetical protein